MSVCTMYAYSSPIRSIPHKSNISIVAKPFRGSSAHEGRVWVSLSRSSHQETDDTTKDGTPESSDIGSTSVLSRASCSRSGGRCHRPCGSGSGGGNGGNRRESPGESGEWKGGCAADSVFSGHGARGVAVSSGFFGRAGVAVLSGLLLDGRDGRGCHAVWVVASDKGQNVRHGMLKV
ncbi:uncharacterized protein EV422DRAFT_530649 [Fimicolochytrium jonesii]|uniref:uncharacterized protein n=1 Tax=Fimicolochytrium jonesii TaxID=1396493 RepID=UPI0022FDB688|nr:uncharacterized protein EV422DRAFT_530649 [Fimicolochytrium jonesii]KAI8820374.1 hypothetical protein EV422DRAFT_530649 [Fimicolochytrium jonesii]